MHKRHLYCCISFLIFTFLKFAEADVSLRVFTKDEGLYENNISKPRFYIQNFGTVPLSNFYCYYYFSIENSKIPQVEDYYTPDASITLENMGGGNYRVKFLFSGITINPGQTLPNPDGEIIGLHYTDWSAWDKTNDYSNTRTGSFNMNGNIPVYSSSGILIYGNDPGTPVIPPQPPRVNTETANYAILSSEFTDLRDGCEVKGGDAGSNEYIEAGCDAVVKGSLFSGGNMFLRERAHIYSDVAAIKEIREQNGIIVKGSKRSNAQLQIPAIKAVTVTPGTTDTIIANNSICTLYPGNYRDVQVFSRSVITLMPGNYVFNQFRTEPHVTIVLKASNNERINIKSAGEIRFADSTVMIFEADTSFPYSVNIETAQTGQMFIGNDCQIYGSITAPNAEVHVFSRTHLYGSIFGKKVVIERGSSVCKPPVLLDVWHSEWAYSPPFSSSILDYTAVVPDITSTLVIKPVASSGSTISINGSSSDTISLWGSETDVAIKVNNPDQCNTTTYNVNVKKSANCQIFVNDNSPCFDGYEDGLSWSTAFKDLQKALDNASSGKEIWVAEGIYKPNKRIDDSNPRTATFLIKAGIEIKGGFIGTETEDDPQGSPYNTILSGDISGNDDSISTWPPSITDEKYLNDNVYHVVTTDGNTKSIRIKGLMIQQGVANGVGDNRFGAGVFNKQSYPTFELCGIQYNLADSSGAGIYGEKGIKSIVNCLFKNNVSLKGSGGGLFLNANDSVKIDASVFDGNITNDTSSELGGGALFISGTIVDVVNSVFTRNNANGKGGAIFNNESNLKLTNCTFYNNSALKGFGGINSQISKDTIINTILWNNNGEMSDTTANITYSCVNGGFRGIGNFSSYPAFVNASKPEGNDGIYGTIDDGLMLAATSPCLNIALVSKSPLTDILGIFRPTGTGAEIGAYEYVDPIRHNKISFGRLSEGVFHECNDFDRILQMVHHKEIYQYSKSRYHRVVRGYVEKNDYTNRKNTITAYITPIDSIGNSLAKEIEIKLIKTGEENGMLVFQSMSPGYEGKKIIFTGDPLWHGYANPWAYVVYASTKKPGISYRVPRDQFK